jgi:hypothetical protein
MTDPRWRQSAPGLGFKCRDQNGPAASEPAKRSASLLHGPDPCRSNRIQVWSAPGCATIAGSPRIERHRRVPDRCQRAAVLGAVKDKPFGWRFAPSLTAPARDGHRNCGRDGRMLAARVEQKNGRRNIKSPPLTNEVPYKAGTQFTSKRAFARELRQRASSRLSSVPTASCGVTGSRPCPACSLRSQAASG